VKLLPPLLVQTLKSKLLRLPEETTREAKENPEKIKVKRVREKKENQDNKTNKRRKHSLLLNKLPSKKKVRRNLLPSVKEEEEEGVKVNSDQLF
jgi:hypothetical protein